MVARGRLLRAHHVQIDKAEGLMRRGVVFTSPYRVNRTRRRFEDHRRLRTYRHRWIIERTIGSFFTFRRLVVRYERDPNLYLAFFQFAAALIVLRRL